MTSFQPHVRDASVFGIALVVAVLALSAATASGSQISSQRLVPPAQPSASFGRECCWPLVDTIADLRALAPPVQPVGAVVRGYFAPEDRGGGTFAWAPDCALADDGGLVFVPDANPPFGRWKRVFSGPVVLNWFGLEEGADVGPRLQAVFDQLDSGQPGHFKLLPGIYESSVALKIANPSQQIWDMSGVELDFHATVNGVLLEIGDAAARNYVFDTVVHAPEVNHGHANELDVAARASQAETIGLRTTNLYHGVVDGITARHCTIGFQPFATDGKGNVYNEYHLRQFKNCIVSVRPAIEDEGAGGTGWTNENLYLGGRFWNNWGAASLLEAHVILPGTHSCNQNVFMKPSFEGQGANAVRLIGSANVILHPRPEFVATGGAAAQLDGEHASVVDFPAALIAINPASTGNMVEMLYWTGDVEPYATAEPASFGNRWRSRERSFVSLSAPSDNGDFQPQRALERGAAILNATPADVVRDLYANSGIPWGRRYEAARSAVSQSVAIGAEERYQLHHYSSWTTERVGRTAHMHSDTADLPPPNRKLAGGNVEPLTAGDTFVGVDGVRWRYTLSGWKRCEPVHLAAAAVGVVNTAIAHGLPYTPTEVTLLPRANAVVWRSSAPTATHVFLQADQPVDVDVYVR
jgi:hypothetical protein